MLFSHIKTNVIKSLLKGPWTLSKLVAGRDIFRSHLYSHLCCLKKAYYVEVMDDYLCQYNINTQQIIYAKFDQPGLKTRILAPLNACSQFSVHNFVTSSHFSKVSFLTIRVTGFCCCYVSTPSLVNHSDGANYLGIDSQTALDQQIRFFRSHMAGRDGSVTSSHLFYNISENNGTAT